MNVPSLTLMATVAALFGASPSFSAVSVYTDEAAFDAAIGPAAVYTPLNDAAFGTTSYSFGSVTETAPILETYTGDYGAGVRSLGAFLDPVNFTSTQTALGLSLGYYIGPQSATYTIDGVMGTIMVPDNAASPNTTFIGFVDNKPISVSFATDGAEFDTLRVISASTISAAPEPGTWILMFGGMAMLGAMLRFGRRTQGAARGA